MDIIVNLISNQTIPNLQFLKKFYKSGDHLLFLNTEKMIDRGVQTWLIDTFKKSNLIEDDYIHTLSVNEYNHNQIKAELSKFDFDIYEQIYVNVTGGTKIMSLAAHEFFKEKAAQIYYVTGKDDTILKLFPNRNKSEEKLNVKINHDEYLSAYGFETTRSSLSGNSKEYSEQFLSWFISENKNENNYQFIRKIQSTYRRRNCNIAELPGLKEFLNEIKYTVENGVRLSKKDTKYLSGDWFEEYVYFNIKNELNLDDDEISTGVQLIKNNVNNEFDVTFIRNNTFYVIECKTYIINKDLPTLVNDTFYKLSSLTNQLGLFCEKYVCTLNNLSELKETQRMRANELGIKLIGLEEINQLISDKNDVSIANLLNIK